MTPKKTGHPLFLGDQPFLKGRMETGASEGWDGLAASANWLSPFLPCLEGGSFAHVWETADVLLDPQQVELAFCISGSTAAAK